MPSDVVTELSGRPSPHESRVGGGMLTFLLFAAPTAWFLQTVVNFSLVSNGCTDASAARTFLHEGWGWLWWGILAVNLAGIALAAAAVVAAVYVWRKARDEARGAAHGLVEVGEGRSRFLASWGIVGGASFYVLGVLFGTVFIFLLPLCAS